MSVVPVASNREIDLYYAIDGEGDGETVAFVGDVGYGAWIWSALQPEVAGPRETLVWDLRGTGRSDAPAGLWDADGLAADLEAVLADAGVDRAHLVGAGLGGMVALRYARKYGRARSLVLCCTAGSGDALDERALRSLHPKEQDSHTLRGSLEGAFTEAFLTDYPAIVEQIVVWRREEDAGPDAVAAQTSAALAFDADPLYDIALPTLVCNGVDDPVVPEAAGRTLADELPRGEYEAVAGRHLAFLEAGTAVADRLVTFLDEIEAG